jgi:hypothetical protein
LHPSVVGQAVEMMEVRQQAVRVPRVALAAVEAQMERQQFGPLVQESRVKVITVALTEALEQAILSLRVVAVVPVK